MRLALPLLLLVFSVATSLPAAVITVNTLADEYDSGNDCSLREAVEAANNDAPGRGCAGGSAFDTILFDGSLNGTIQLTLGEISKTGVGLEIVSEPPLRIGVAAAPSARIFDLNGAGVFRVQGLVLVGGRPSSGSGGAINSTSDVQVEILDSILRDHHGVDGGAVHVGAAVDTPSPLLVVRDSRFGGNVSTGLASTGEGGAIYVSAVNDTSTDASPSVRIERSVFTDNEAGSRGGAISLSDVYGLLDRVAIVGNRSASGGGGLYFNVASIDLLNVTVAANVGSTVGGVLGAYLRTTDEVRIGFSTVIWNESTTGFSAGVGFAASTGQHPSIAMHGTILEGNLGAPDCDDSLAGSYDFASGGDNVFGNVSACTTPVGSDLEPVTPLTFSLGETAGDTIVALPPTSSPVLDRIAVADCDDLDGAQLSLDQRSGSRPQRAYLPLPGSPPAACDSGAFERKFAEFALWIFKDGFETGNTLVWTSTAP